MSLVAFLAWVGLGADGLSSSAYGPEEAFKRARRAHRYLAVFLALATARPCSSSRGATAASSSSSRTAAAATSSPRKLLGPYVGAVSGCALLVDYVLTIAISLAVGADAVFSFLPASWHAVQARRRARRCSALLVVMNLRGVKESVMVLTPIFLVFLVTHAS